MYPCIIKTKAGSDRNPTSKPEEVRELIVVCMPF